MSGFTALFLLFTTFVLRGAPESLLAQGGAVLLAGLLAGGIAMRAEGKSLSSLGLPMAGAGRGMAVGGALGIAIVLPGLALAVVAGGLRYGVDRGTWIEYLATGAWTAVILLVPAAGEEVLFRGYPMRVLLERWGPAAAVAITSIAFAALHGWNPEVGPMALVNIGLAGVLLGIVCLTTGSLWWATGVHAGWNFGTGFLADLPVSGVRLVDTPLLDVVEPGAAVWTGGAFGLEGGAAAMIALSLGIGLTLKKGVLSQSRQAMRSGSVAPLGRRDLPLLFGAPDGVGRNWNRENE